MTRLAVIGLGLIGGSLARALRATHGVSHIAAYDPDREQARRGIELGVIDVAAPSAAEAAHRADVVVLAVPVLHTAEAASAVKAGLAPDAILTDVGSTKVSVLEDLTRVFDGLPPRFVAAHPIAGTEKSGVAAARADLFRGHRVVLTPHASQDAQALATVRGLWESVGARVVEMDAHCHDAIFAATSHLPHVLAYAFVDMLTRLDNAADIFPNAGGGFRDFTRIASSSPEMWHDIVRANRVEVTGLLERQIGELQELLALMRDERWSELKQRFARARAARERYLPHIE
ncbi:prephenate dehydrogenase [Panacagrimonas sp.]|uniref:prephenate dehydrogenase n=1 Tax=Panacagrimonas sp. TaxID=2480088 RepID=UPI003B525E64